MQWPVYVEMIWELLFTEGSESYSFAKTSETCLFYDTFEVLVQYKNQICRNTAKPVLRDHSHETTHSERPHIYGPVS